MSAGHLGCGWCRIRVPASAPAIDLLEALCPICEAPLARVPATSVVGFRLFDLDPFSPPEATAAPDEPAAPAHPVVRAATFSARRDGAANHPRRLP